MTTTGEDVNLFRVARIVVGVYRKTHLVTADEAEEMLGDACLGAVKGLHSHDPHREGNSGLGAWVYYRARNEMLDGIRRRGPISRGDWAKGVRSTDDLPDSARRPYSYQHEDWTADPADPHDQYEQVDNRLTVLRLLGLVTGRDREFVEQHYLHGIPQTVLGARHGLSPTGGRVKQILNRSCQVMRSALENAA